MATWQKRKKAKNPVGKKGRIVLKKTKKVFETFTPKKTAKEQIVEEFSQGAGDGLLCQSPGCVNPVAEGQNAVCKDHIRRS